MLLCLELKKIRKPVLITLFGMTILACILTCTLYRDYQVCFVLDPWEIGTEYFGLLFPLLVTVPICWQLYYERRNHFLIYTLPRISKKRYMGAKWLAYALAAFLIVFIPYFLSALCSIYIANPSLQPPSEKYIHILYVLTVAWLKIPAFTKLPLSILTCLNHWVMLLHNLTEPWRFPLTLIVALILIAGMLWSVHQCWQKDTAISRRQKSGLAVYYQGVLFIRGNLLLLNGSILLSAAWAFLSGGPVKDGSEWIIRLFAGHGTGYFHMMEFFALLIAEVLPLWPVGGLFSQVTNGGAAFQVIRLRRKKELLDALLQVSFLWLMFWGVCLLCVTVIPVLVLSIPFDMKLLTMCIGLRILDVGLQLLLFLLLLCYTKRATIGFLCILMLHLLCVLPVPWFPVGISSLYRIYLPETAGAVPVSMAASELALGWIVLLVRLNKRGIQQLFDKYGGLL